MKNGFEIRLQRRKLLQKHFLEFENDPNSFSGHTFGFFFVKIRREKHGGLHRWTCALTALWPRHHAHEYTHVRGGSAPNGPEHLRLPNGVASVLSRYLRGR